jgi:hypothetical protein
MKFSSKFALVAAASLLSVSAFAADAASFALPDTKAESLIDLAEAEMGVETDTSLFKVG